MTFLSGVHFLTGPHCKLPPNAEGDADSTWVTLQAEVNMTKTAANVLFVR
jgi:hypothetical protein